MYVIIEEIRLKLNWFGVQYYILHQILQITWYLYVNMAVLFLHSIFLAFFKLDMIIIINSHFLILLDHSSFIYFSFHSQGSIQSIFLLSHDVIITYGAGDNLLSLWETRNMEKNPIATIKVSHFLFQFSFLSYEAFFRLNITNVLILLVFLSLLFFRWYLDNRGSWNSDVNSGITKSPWLQYRWYWIISWNEQKSNFTWNFQNTVFTTNSSKKIDLFVHAIQIHSSILSFFLFISLSLLILC